MENQQRIQYANQAIMLDLSLFIVDLLDTEKIKRGSLAPDHILEVPSSLVLMMRDSNSGSPILFLFMYALLKKLIKEQKQREDKNKDQRILELISSSDQEIRQKAWKASTNLTEYFSPLIAKEEITFTPDKNSLPIKRFDDIRSLSPREQEKLRSIYTTEIELPVHPLYDLYFAQIYDALSANYQNFSYLEHKNISLINSTFNVLKQWKNINSLHEEKNRDIISVSRELIKWFIFSYVRDDWKNMLFDTTLSLAVDFVQHGHIGISSITLAAGTIIPKVITQIPPRILTSTERIILFIIFMAFFFICVVVITRPEWLLPPKTSTPSPAATSVTEPLSTPTTISITTEPTTVPTPTHTLTPTPTQFPTPAPTISSLNSCLYVTQLGDTAQSISAWFGISETLFRQVNNLLSGTEFTEHIMVTISAPCCNTRYPNGSTYSVQKGDTVANLSQNLNISPEALAGANNLREPWYIQEGQMLCLP